MTVEIRTTDEERFYKAEDGEEVPSVTTILSVIDKSGPLVPWAVKTTCDYIQQEVTEAGKIAAVALDEQEITGIIDKARKEATRIKEEAGDMGTLIHLAIQEWAEAMIKGEEVFFVHFDSPRMQAAWEAFESFAEKHRLEPIKSELRMVHQAQRYGGMIDLIATIRERDGTKKRLLIDIKSSNHFLEIPHGPQVAAYAAMLPPKSLEGIAVLRLDKKTGEPDFHLLTERQEDYLAVFKGAQTLWKSLQAIKSGRKKGKKK